MSLRALIEAKERRVDHLRVQVGDLAGAARTLALARAALVALERTRQALDEAPPVPDDQLERLREAVAKAIEQERACFVNVQLQSLPDDEWDAILSHAPRDEDGEIDLEDVRAELIAASCVDEELRDPAWWEEQLAKPTWSKGDKLAATNLLLQLNLHVPTGAVGKG